MFFTGGTGGTFRGGSSWRRRRRCEKRRRAPSGRQLGDDGGRLMPSFCLGRATSARVATFAGGCRRRCRIRRERNVRAELDVQLDVPQRRLSLGIAIFVLLGFQQFVCDRLQRATADLGLRLQVVRLFCRGSGSACGAAEELARSRGLLGGRLRSDILLGCLGHRVLRNRFGDLDRVDRSGASRSARKERQDGAFRGRLRGVGGLASGCPLAARSGTRSRCRCARGRPSSSRSRRARHQVDHALLGDWVDLALGNAASIILFEKATRRTPLGQDLLRRLLAEKETYGPMKGRSSAVLPSGKGVRWVKERVRGSYTCWCRNVSSARRKSSR